MFTPFSHEPASTPSSVFFTSVSSTSRLPDSEERQGQMSTAPRTCAGPQSYAELNYDATGPPQYANHVHFDALNRFSSMPPNPRALTMNTRMTTHSEHHPSNKIYPAPEPTNTQTHAAEVTSAHPTNNVVPNVVGEASMTSPPVPPNNQADSLHPTSVVGKGKRKRILTNEVLDDYAQPQTLKFITSTTGPVRRVRKITDQSQVEPGRHCYDCKKNFTTPSTLGRHKKKCHKVNGSGDRSASGEAELSAAPASKTKKPRTDWNPAAPESGPQALSRIPDATFSMGVIKMSSHKTQPKGYERTPRRQFIGENYGVAAATQVAYRPDTMPSHAAPLPQSAGPYAPPPYPPPQYLLAHIADSVIAQPPETVAQIMNFQARESQAAVDMFEEVNPRNRVHNVPSYPAPHLSLGHGRRTGTTQSWIPGGTSTQVLQHAMHQPSLVECAPFIPNLRNGPYAPAARDAFQQVSGYGLSSVAGSLNNLATYHQQPAHPTAGHMQSHITHQPQYDADAHNNPIIYDPAGPTTERYMEELNNIQPDLHLVQLPQHGLAMNQGTTELVTQANPPVDYGHIAQAEDYAEAYAAAPAVQPSQQLLRAFQTKEVASLTLEAALAAAAAAAQQEDASIPVRTHTNPTRRAAGPDGRFPLFEEENGFTAALSEWFSTFANTGDVDPCAAASNSWQDLPQAIPDTDNHVSTNEFSYTVVTPTMAENADRGVQRTSPRQLRRHTSQTTLF
ncbi:hypothetical protein H0H81_002276 [Sphagnurus paluster]|uniref:C2H2-type domain-containing protein n=1 Tax=Sphagnurus paluster TaxID=117069 RepID=A0A9P7K5R2_9AGAR|nr:hypothetical protein H0H81_002276 [Sphagnurus paluster]